MLPCAQRHDQKGRSVYVEYVCCACNVRPSQYSTSPFCPRANSLSPLPSTSFPLHYSLVILPCNIIPTELTTASLNKQIYNFHVSLKLDVTLRDILVTNKIRWELHIARIPALVLTIHSR
jgi:hypothetical protein